MILLSNSTIANVDKRYDGGWMAFFGSCYDWAVITWEKVILDGPILIGSTVRDR